MSKVGVCVGCLEGATLVGMLVGVEEGASVGSNEGATVAKQKCGSAEL
jgi:hypothetical protein